MIKLTTPGGLRAGLVAFFFLASACTGSLETTDAGQDDGWDAGSDEGAGDPGDDRAADDGGEADAGNPGDDGSADGDAGGDAGGDAVWIDPPTVTISPPTTDGVFLNPERGFYRTLNLVNDRGYDWVRQGGYTLAHSYIRLDDYRDRDLDSALLDAAAAGFAEARAAGIKIILRFAYNFGPYPDSDPDASKAWVLRHIEQLQPLLAQNADVIAVMQAGFIGAWGEWHTSTNGLLDDPQDKFDILEAILQALPSDRAVQLRYPPYKQEGYGGPLTESEAHSGSPASRVGHHNDCFLASDTDWGTYPSDEIEYWKNYLEADCLFVPNGGETCNPNPPRSECAVALFEMERLHYTYINNEYHPDVVSSWTSGGCREEMERRLGYRLALLEVGYPEQAPPGGVLPLDLRIENTGYAAPINPRPVIIVLDGPASYSAEIPSTDLRKWLPGEETRIPVRIQLPADAPTGSYTLSIHLPDAASDLRDDPRYAIRLANQDTWDAATGFNRLATVTLDPSAPGSTDPRAERFEAIE
jgi:hypothetical protein